MKWETGMRLKLRPKVIDVIVILIVGGVSFGWFRGDNMLWGADANFPLDVDKSLDRYSYIWNHKEALGGIDARKLPFLMPIGLLLKIYSFFNLPFSPLIFQRILIYLLLVGSGLSAYVLASTFLDEKALRGRLIVALFYMLNFYNLVVIWSPLAYIVFQYAFLPLIIALYIKGLSERKSLKYATFVALIWSITATPGYMTTSIVIIDCAIIFLYLVFHIIITQKVADAKHALIFTFYLLITWGLLNMFWIMPAALFSSEELIRAETVTNGIELYKLNSVPMLDAFRLTGYFGLRDSYKGSPYFPWHGVYETIPFLLLSFLTPILVWLAVLLKPKSKHVLFFSILSLLALLMVKGPYPPFGEFNLFIFSRFSLYTVFRSNYQRFMEYVVLGYSVLLGVAVDKLLTIKFKHSHTDMRRHLKHFSHVCSFLVLVFLLCGVYMWPFWTGDLYSSEGVIPSKRIKIPPYYYEATKWLDEQPEDFNVLPLPFGKVLSAYWWENGTQGYLGTNPFLLLSSKPTIVKDYNNELVAHSVSLIINQTLKNVKILNLLNVKYIIFHRDSAWAYIEGHDWWISGSPEQLQSVLSSQEGLYFEKTFGQLDLYRNEYWTSSRIYVASTAILIDGNLTDMIKTVERNDFPLNEYIFFLRSQNDLQQLLSTQALIVDSKLDNLGTLSPVKNKPIVIYEKIDPTKYIVHVNDSNFPFFLVLSETFHKDWIAYIEGKQIKSHFTANGYANSWYINKTGSYDVILELRPQKLFYAGSAISLITFIFGVIYISKDYAKSLYQSLIKKRLRFKF